MNRTEKRKWQFYSRNGNKYEFRTFLSGIYGELWLRYEVDIETFWGRE